MVFFFKRQSISIGNDSEVASVIYSSLSASPSSAGVIFLTRDNSSSLVLFILFFLFQLNVQVNLIGTIF